MPFSPKKQSVVQWSTSECIGEYVWLHIWKHVRVYMGSKCVWVHMGVCPSAHGIPSLRAYGNMSKCIWEYVWQHIWDQCPSAHESVSECIQEYVQMHMGVCLSTYGSLHMGVWVHVGICLNAYRMEEGGAKSFQWDSYKQQKQEKKEKQQLISMGSNCVEHGDGDAVNSPMAWSPTSCKVQIAWHSVWP